MSMLRIVLCLYKLSSIQCRHYSIVNVVVVIVAIATVCNTNVGLYLNNEMKSIEPSLADTMAVCVGVYQYVCCFYYCCCCFYCFVT